MRRESKFNSINVVPFVDIMLVLLVIVLLSASFIEKGEIKTKLPTASAKRSKIKRDIKITIKANGLLYLGKEHLSKEEFKSKLASYKKSSNIFIYANRNLKYSKFVEVLDILQNSGFSNISIVTQK